MFVISVSFISYLAFISYFCFKFSDYSTLFQQCLYNIKHKTVLMLFPEGGNGDVTSEDRRIGISLRESNPFRV